LPPSNPYHYMMLPICILVSHNLLGLYNFHPIQFHNNRQTMSNRHSVLLNDLAKLLYERISSKDAYSDTTPLPVQPMPRHLLHCPQDHTSMNPNVREAGQICLDPRYLECEYPRAGT